MEHWVFNIHKIQWVKYFSKQAIASHQNCHIKFTIGVGIRKFTGYGSKCIDR